MTNCNASMTSFLNSGNQQDLNSTNFSSGSNFGLTELKISTRLNF